MRGKGKDNPQIMELAGITPAYAGKSALRAAGHSAHRDHPRLCGEKRSNVRSFERFQGSPPPMRGKV